MPGTLLECPVNTVKVSFNGNKQFSLFLKQMVHVDTCLITKDTRQTLKTLNMCNSFVQLRNEAHVIDR